MQHLLATIIFLFISSATYAAIAATHPTDSLLVLLKKSHTPKEKIQVYRNLADIFMEKPQKKTYLLKMYEEAKRVNNRTAMLDALNDIVIDESKSYEKDSIVKYINYVKQIATPDELIRLLPFYHMRFFDTLCYQNKGKEAVDEELKFLNAQNGKEADIYRSVALDYATGTSLYNNRQFEKSVPFFQKAVKQTEKFPPKEKYIYQKFIVYRLCYALAQSEKGKEAAIIMESLILQIEKNYEENYKKQRPFYKIELYLLQYYTFMISSLPFLNIKQETYYWNRILEISKHLTDPIDKYNFYLCANNYYSNNHTKIDLPKAIAANDSLIKFAKTLAPKYLPTLYITNSVLYKKANNYSKALESMEIAYRMKDSLSSDDAHKQLNELQVKYDLNALNNEKNKLVIKNKQILVISLSILLSIVITICTYLYFSLKKEKKMKKQMKHLHLKAQESEKMKQAFINSICHEIRTPLNAIVGFSDLIMNDDIDEEMRREFPAEIQKSTTLLTDLVNSMLEVANLDVSEDKLPCEPTDLTGIFVQTMENLPKKKNIEYKIDIPNESMYIHTNMQYLTQVIEHLLNNANKFTEKGFITIDYKMDKKDNYIYIHITDTGCGIPKEKHEEVFDRFAKLDTFVPGNGLGLYLCRLILKRLAGEVNIDPDYTTGTRMIVSLPIK